MDTSPQPNILSRMTKEKTFSILIMLIFLNIILAYSFFNHSLGVSSQTFAAPQQKPNNPAPPAASNSANTSNTASGSATQTSSCSPAGGNPGSSDIQNPSASGSATASNSTQTNGKKVLAATTTNDGSDSIAADPTQYGYVQLPLAKDGSYIFQQSTCTNHRWGSQLLVGVLYTAAQRWKEKHPSGYLIIHNLNTDGQNDNKWGNAADITATTNGVDSVADLTSTAYNRQATIELGNIFVDLDVIKNIWFNDQEVNNAILNHSKQTGRSSDMKTRPVLNNDDHFHIDIQLDPLLSEWTPGC